MKCWLPFIILLLLSASYGFCEQKGKPVYWSLTPSTYKGAPSHGGGGSVKLSPIYGTPDFVTNLRAISRGEIPPNCGIGEHVHRGMEEIFIILNANARFTVNGHTSELPPRAMVVCQKGSSHGIYNSNSNVSLDWLYFAVSMVKDKWDAVDFGDDLSNTTLESPPPFKWTLLDRQLLKSYPNAQGGNGEILFRRCYDENSFYTNLEYIDHIILPPGTSIGYHKHLMTEEIYYLVSGSGKVTVNDVAWDVKEGDAVPCTINDSHGISNNSNKEIELVVVAASLEKGKRDNNDLADYLSNK